MFELDREFVNGYKDKPAPFGYNGLGYLVYMRTYSREKADGLQEDWFETIERVVNGTFSILVDHCNKNEISYNHTKLDFMAREMYDLMFNMKFLPPGRGLASMHYEMLNTKHTFASLNNCGYVSTQNLDKDSTYPFAFMMDMSMLGVGVGFDTKGANKIKIRDNDNHLGYTLQIGDSREGWVTALKYLLEYWFGLTYNKPIFDYSFIRKEGEKIKGFGGVSSGHKPLKKMLDHIDQLLNENMGKPISSKVITDIMNIIGVCVVSGNVRRSSQIALGDPTDDSFLDLKNYAVYPERVTYGWTSNNTVIIDRQEVDYSKFVDRVFSNGEPGFFWIDNARKYGRMSDKPNYKDNLAMGCNPCGEQTLEDGELCCLVELFPSRCKDKQEFEKAIKYAFLYAKVVTLCKTGYPKTDEIIERNRRIGTSATGINTFLGNYNKDILTDRLENGYEVVQYYDDVYSQWLKINKSTKTTSVKPSGTVSLLAGVTPGIKYPESNYYIRRVRIAENSPLIKGLVDAGYHIEKAINEDNTVVAEFPIYEPSEKTIKNVTMKDQLELAYLMQDYWSDNQVSCTITIKEEDRENFVETLKECSKKLKSVSFLPYFDSSSTKYKQLPYEPITKELYESLVSKLKPIDFKYTLTRDSEDQFCDGDRCQL